MKLSFLIKYQSFFLCLLFFGCKFYNFTGGSVGDAKTFQVKLFQNMALLVEAGFDRDFTIALQEVIQSQTNLNLVNENPDLTYEGEITEYSISPMTALANQTAAENRFELKVNVRYVNKKEEQKDFERSFSFFYDFPATTQFISVREDAYKTVFDRITQDIFNASLASW